VPPPASLHARFAPLRQLLHLILEILHVTRAVGGVSVRDIAAGCDKHTKGRSNTAAAPRGARRVAGRGKVVQFTQKLIIQSPSRNVAKHAQ